MQSQPSSDSLTRATELEALAAFVHGALAAFHLLGVIYNARRRNWFDVAAHSAGVVYDGYAMNKHLKRTR
jgi:hypothetical protein